MLRPNKTHSYKERGNKNQDSKSPPHTESQTDHWFYLQVLRGLTEWAGLSISRFHPQGFYLSQTKAQASFTNSRPAQNQPSGHRFTQGIKLENGSGLKLIAERKKKKKG